MKLITKTLMSRFNEIGNQSEFENPIIVTKLYSTKADIAWYIIKHNTDCDAYYGYVTGHLHGDGFYYFSVTDLEHRSKRYKLDLTRDIHFKEIRFNDLIKKLT
ncbi:DUF2958 domain-containing protein [Pontimicrobium sp. MEBiC01747]